MKFSKWRNWVALMVFLSVIVGLVVHTGTGTPSALGWRDIALICPVGALEVLAGAKAFLVHPIALLVAVLLIGVVAGRAFCAWVCPVPHVSNFFRPKKKVGKKEAEDVAEATVVEDTGEASASEPVVESAPAARAEREPLAPVGGERDGKRFDSRHAVLLGAVASSFAFGFPVFCIICPVGLCFGITIGVWNLFAFNETSWGLIVFPLVLIAEVVLFRKWCHTFCPISALLSLVSSKRGWRPRVSQNKCLRGHGVNCTECVEVCPERVDPHSEVIAECTKCGACSEYCPAHAISMKLFGGASKQAELEVAEKN